MIYVPRPATASGVAAIFPAATAAVVVTAWLLPLPLVSLLLLSCCCCCCRASVLHHLRCSTENTKAVHYPASAPAKRFGDSPTVYQLRLDFAVLPFRYSTNKPVIFGRFIMEVEALSTHVARRETYRRL